MRKFCSSIYFVPKMKRISDKKEIKASAFGPELSELLSLKCHSEVPP